MLTPKEKEEMKLLMQRHMWKHEGRIRTIRDRKVEMDKTGADPLLLSVETNDGVLTPEEKEEMKLLMKRDMWRHEGRIRTVSDRETGQRNNNNPFFWSNEHMPQTGPDVPKCAKHTNVVLDFRRHEKV